MQGRENLFEHLQPLRHRLERQGGCSRDVAARVRKALSETLGDDISRARHDNRDRRGDPARRVDGLACGDDHVDAEINQLRHERGRKAGITADEAILDANGLAFYISEVAESLSQGVGHRLAGRRRTDPNYANPRVAPRFAPVRRAAATRRLHKRAR